MKYTHEKYTYSLDCSIPVFLFGPSWTSQITPYRNLKRSSRIRTILEMIPTHEPQLTSM